MIDKSQLVGAGPGPLGITLASILLVETETSASDWRTPLERVTDEHTKDSSSLQKLMRVALVPALRVCVVEWSCFFSCNEHIFTEKRAAQGKPKNSTSTRGGAGLRWPGRDDEDDAVHHASALQLPIRQGDQRRQQRMGPLVGFHT